MSVVAKIPLEAQIAALANRNAHALLKSHGIEAFDIKPHFSVTRGELVSYLRGHPDLAHGYLLSSSAQRPCHDQLIVEQRGEMFAVYDMDHGRPRGEQIYTDLFEAVADFLSFTYAYVFKKEV